MPVVDYSDSEDDEYADDTPSTKRPKIEAVNDLPSLPASFLDLYSSTVRSSTRDDPSLHGGRKRVIPHIEGNWPTHVYLEWHPNNDDLKALSAAINYAQSAIETPIDIHSLLGNDLGVTSPLHVSLSRPLVLRTQQKDDFLSCIRATIRDSAVHTFAVQPKSLCWHPNEDRSRYFLVLQLDEIGRDELTRLLDHCNRLAADFGQPLLYANSATVVPSTDATLQPPVEAQDQFHISLAWSLDQPASHQDTSIELSPEVAKQLAKLHIPFHEVKIRIGQDVTKVPLAQRRLETKSLFI